MSSPIPYIAAPRKVRPSAPRAPRARAVGDVVAVQKRSSIGATEQQLRTLRTLGLGRIGRQVPQPSADRTTRRQLHRVAHLIEIRPLARVEADRYPMLPIERTRPTVLEPAVVHTDPIPSVLLPLSDGSMLSLEVHPGFYALAWTCELPLLTVVERVSQVLPSISGATVLVVAAIGAPVRRAKAAEILAEMRSSSGRWEFARFDFGAIAVTWEAPHFPNHVDEPVHAGEFGIILPAFDPDLLCELVVGTGSEAIGDYATELVARADPTDLPRRMNVAAGHQDA